MNKKTGDTAGQVINTLFKKKSTYTEKKLLTYSQE